MNLPLFTTDDVVHYLHEMDLGPEVFSEFPQDGEVVRNGIYVSDVTTTDRTPYQLAVMRGANIYTITDMLRIIFVTYQGDQYKERVLSALDSIVDAPYTDGYHERDYSVEETWMNRAEYKTYDYTLKRIQLV